MTKWIRIQIINISLRLLLFFLKKKNFQIIFPLLFRLFLCLKSMKHLDTMAILIISICLRVQILYFESKMFFYSFQVIFCPLDPDLDPGSQIFMDPTNSDTNYIIPHPPKQNKLKYQRGFICFLRFVHNLIHRHRGLDFLLDSPDRINLYSDPFIPEERDPTLCKVSTIHKLLNEFYLK